MTNSDSNLTYLYYLSFTLSCWAKSFFSVGLLLINRTKQLNIYAFSPLTAEGYVTWWFLMCGALACAKDKNGSVLATTVRLELVFHQPSLFTCNKIGAAARVGIPKHQAFLKAFTRTVRR